MNQAIGATAIIKWLSDGEIVEGYFFSFGNEGEFNEKTGDYEPDSNGFEDGSVFFWCDGENALKSYMTEGIEDFKVLSYELEYEEITA
jgi:hypothetical protein